MQDVVSGLNATLDGAEYTNNRNWRKLVHGKSNIVYKDLG